MYTISFIQSLPWSNLWHAFLIFFYIFYGAYDAGLTLSDLWNAFSDMTLNIVPSKCPCFFLCASIFFHLLHSFMLPWICFHHYSPQSLFSSLSVYFDYGFTLRAIFGTLFLIIGLYAPLTLPFLPSLFLP